MVVPGTAAVYVPLLLVRDQSAGSGVWSALSSALFLSGAAIYLWCVWDFATFGRGTPAPIDAPKKLVVRGLYRYTRNPMYLGVLSTVLGWVVLFQAPGLLLYAVGLGLCFHLFVVLYEEPHLEELFGGPYREYRSTVGRWLPRTRRRKRAAGPRREPPTETPPVSGGADLSPRRTERRGPVPDTPDPETGPESVRTPRQDWLFW